jgi:hypothetical protein
VAVDRVGLAAELAEAAGFDAVAIAPAPGAGQTFALAGLAVRIVALGWATVDLDRAWAELSAPEPAAEPASGPRPARASARDDLLGARTRWSADDGGGIGLILLEPDTEGRLAASLAHRGEGPVALYLAPVGIDLAVALERIGAGGLRVRTGETALGPGAVVLGRPADGLQVLLVAVPSLP